MELMKAPLRPTPEAAEMLAIQALGFIAEDTDRLAGFLAATGIPAEEIRAAAGAPDFLAGVLEHMLGDESLLIAFALTRRNRSGRGRARPQRARRSTGTQHAVSAFCRDCLADAAPHAARCGSCGSPRLLRHRELATAGDRPRRLRRLLRHDRKTRRSLPRRRAGHRRRRPRAASSPRPAMSPAPSA